MTGGILHTSQLCSSSRLIYIIVDRDCRNSECIPKMGNDFIEVSFWVDKSFQKLFQSAEKIQFSLSPNCWWVFLIDKKKT